MSTICQILCQVLGIPKEVGVLLLKELTDRPERGSLPMILVQQHQHSQLIRKANSGAPLQTYYGRRRGPSTLVVQALQVIQIKFDNHCSVCSRSFSLADN